MLRAYKYRIYPSEEQRTFFAKTFGCVRFVYNKMLHDRQLAYQAFQEHGVKQKSKGPAFYKTDYPFLKEVDSLALAKVQLNLDRAYKNFFRDKNVGFPQFKRKKSNHHSYTTNNQKGTVAVVESGLKLPKLKIAVKMPHATSKTGLDVGLKDFCVTSSGEKISNPKHFRAIKNRLAKRQKELSRKQKGSKNRQKARLKVAILHEKIACQRQDFLHKLSIQMIRDNQTIVIEDLRVKNMLQNHKLAKAISEASWSEFRRMLAYKAEWHGRELLIAPTHYASSQLCSDCGHKHAEVKNLKVREWVCPVCSAYHDRDVNAALNLVKLAG